MSHHLKSCTRIFRFALVLVAFGLSSLQAIELRLNGEVLSVMGSEQMHSYTTPTWLYNEKMGVPLNALYPWMDSVFSITIEADGDSFQWKSDSLEPSIWNHIYIVETEEGSDVWIKDKIVLSNPEQVVVLGIKLTVPTLRIWSMSENPDLETRIRGELSPQKINIEWKDIRYPGKLMEHSTPETLPHLLLADDITIIRFPEMLESYFPLFFRTSRWQTRSSSNKKSNLSEPFAVDASSPQAPLIRFFSDNLMFFDSRGKLPQGLSDFLKNEIDAKGERLIFSEDPEESLRSGEAESMVTFSNPLEKTKKNSLELETVPPSQNYVNLARIFYVAVPAGLSTLDNKIAFLSMNRLLRYQKYAEQGALSLPLDSRIVRFFDAYERVGRLVISGQITPNRGVELIQAYVDDSVAIEKQEE